MEEQVLHTIKAALYDNALTADPNDLVARVASERSLTIKNICQTAASRGGADVSAAAMEHAVSLFFKEMAYNLMDGYSINTGYFSAAPVIRGVFASATEPFDPAKHRILFEFQQGVELRKEVAQVRVQITGLAESGFYIAQVTDVRSGSVNDLLTPNRNLKIAGSKLKIAGEAEACGVYFVAEADGARTKVEAADIVTNNPSELVIVIPPLTAGSYRLEVTTQCSTNSKQLLKEPRTTMFEKVLTVQ